MRHQVINRHACRNIEPALSLMHTGSLLLGHPSAGGYNHIATRLTRT